MVGVDGVMEGGVNRLKLLHHKGGWNISRKVFCLPRSGLIVVRCGWGIELTWGGRYQCTSKPLDCGINLFDFSSVGSTRAVLCKSRVNWIWDISAKSI